MALNVVNVIVLNGWCRTFRCFDVCGITRGSDLSLWGLCYWCL